MAVPCLVLPSGNEAIPPDYQRYVQLQPSQPARDLWVPYDDAAKVTMQGDYRRLWQTGLLSDLTMRVTNYDFPNGVVGKLVTYVIQER